jgi:hypothetical protein
VFDGCGMVLHQVPGKLRVVNNAIYDVRDLASFPSYIHRGSTLKLSMPYILPKCFCTFTGERHGMHSYFFSCFVEPAVTLNMNDRKLQARLSCTYLIHPRLLNALEILHYNVKQDTALTSIHALRRRLHLLLLICGSGYGSQIHPKHRCRQDHPYQEIEDSTEQSFRSWRR